MELQNDLTSAQSTVGRVLALLSYYHNHEITNPEIIPKEGAGILLNNHSLATYDGFLMGMELYKRSGRLVKALGDDLLFKIPKVANFMYELGIYPANPVNAKKLLAQGELLGLAPGGMRESLKPKEQKYKIYWGKRKGFAKLSIETQTPIYLAACPKADDIFTVYENSLTALMYKTFKLPLPLFKGWGPTLLPRPIKLTHTLAGPFYPPKMEKGPTLNRRAISDFQFKIVQEMIALMSRSAA